MNELKRKNLMIITSVVAMLCSIVTFIPTKNVSAFTKKSIYESKDHPFIADKSYGVLSPRAIQLKYQKDTSNNGKMYITFEQRTLQGQDQPSFPIYESLDNGENWSSAPVGKVIDTQNNWGMMNCPELSELPYQIGDMPAGTLLLAGNSVPKDSTKTKMELYKSNDLGRTWQYVSTIAEGGYNDIGKEAVWEPYFLYKDHKMTIYYSDERDPKYGTGQTLVHQTTTDGKTWSSLVEDIAIDEVADPQSSDQKTIQPRPGMLSIVQMGNGQWASTAEGVGFPSKSGFSGLTNFLKISNDPKMQNPLELGMPVGVGGSPYLTKLGDGRLVLNNAGNNEILINDSRQDASGRWVAYPSSAWSAYNRQLLPLDNGRLFVSTGGFFGKNNAISVSDLSVGYYKIVNIKTGQVLSRSNDQLVLSNSFPVNERHTNSIDQYWALSNEDSQKNPFSSLLIISAKDGVVVKDVYDQSTTTVMTDTYSPPILDKEALASNTNQQWSIVPSTAGGFKLVNQKTSRVLTVNNNTIVQANASASDSPEQSWKFVTDDNSNSNSNSNGYRPINSYRLFSGKDSNNLDKVLGIYGGNAADGTKAVLWDSNKYNSFDQDWFIEYESNGNIKFVNAKTGKALAANGSKVVQQSLSDSLNQQWLVDNISSGKYVIRSAANKNAFMVRNGNLQNGTEIALKSTNADDVLAQWDFQSNNGGQNNYNASKVIVPSAPTNVTATQAGDTVVITFTASSSQASDADNAVKQYRVTAIPEGATESDVSIIIKVSGTKSPITVTGLNKNVGYTFKVEALTLFTESAPTYSNTLPPAASSSASS